MTGLLIVFLGGLLGVCSGVSVNRGGYPSFTDEIPFKITWPGPEFTLVSLLLLKRFFFFSNTFNYYQSQGDALSPV